MGNSPHFIVPWWTHRQRHLHAITTLETFFKHQKAPLTILYKAPTNSESFSLPPSWWLKSVLVVSCDSCHKKKSRSHCNFCPACVESQRKSRENSRGNLFPNRTMSQRSLSLICGILSILIVYQLFGAYSFKLYRSSAQENQLNNKKAGFTPVPNLRKYSYLFPNFNFNTQTKVFITQRSEKSEKSYYFMIHIFGYLMVKFELWFLENWTIILHWLIKFLRASWKLYWAGIH